MKRKTLKIVLAVVLALCLSATVAVVAAWHFCLSSPGQRLIRQWINDAIPGTVGWDDLNIGLVAARIELAGLRLDGPDGRRLGTVDRIGVGWRWAPLGRRELHLTAVDIAGLRLKVQSDDQGRLDLLSAFPAASASTPSSPPAAQPWNVVVDKLALKGAAFGWAGPGVPDGSGEPPAASFKGIEIRLEQIDLAARRGKFHLAFGGGQVALPQWHSRCGPFDLGAELADGRLQVDRLDAHLSASRLTAAGTISQLFSDPDTDIELQLAVDLADLQRLSPPPAPLGGKVTARIAVRGTRGNPQADLNLTLRDGALGDTPLPQTTLVCRLDDRRLAIDTLRLEAPYGKAAAEGTVDLRQAAPNGLLAGGLSPDALRYRLKVAAGPLDLAGLPRTAASSVSGSVTLQTELAGTGVAPDTLRLDAGVTFTGSDILAPGMAAPLAAAGEGRIQVADRVVTLAPLAMTSGPHHLAASGRWDVGGGTIEGDLNADSPDLSFLSAVLGLPALKGGLVLQAHASGSLPLPAADIQLETRGAAFDRYTIGDLTLSAAVDSDGRLKIDRLAMVNGDGRLSLQGDVRLLAQDSRAFDPDMEGQLDVSFERVRPADFIPDAPVAGRFTGRLSVQGPLRRQPDARLTITAEALAAGPVTLDSAASTLALHAGAIEVSKLTATRKQSRLAASGRVQLFAADAFTPLPDPEFSLKIGTAQVRLQDLFADLAGEVSLNGSARGTVTRPEGALSVAAGALDIYDQPLDGLDARVRLEGDTVVLEHASVRLPRDGRLAADGRLENWQRLDVSLAVEAVQLAGIQVLSSKGVDSGRLNGTCRVQGTTTNPEASAQIRIDGLQIRAQTLPELALTLNLADQRLTVAGNPGFDLAAEINLAQKDVSGHLKFDETALAPYLELAGLEGFSGQLTGRIDLQGNLGRPKAIAATADIQKLVLIDDALELIRAEPFRVALAEGRLSVPGIRLSLLDQGRLDIRGTGELDGSSDFSAVGTIPLAVVRSFTRKLPDIQGQLQLQASARGALAKPDVSAELTLDDVGLTVPEVYQRLHAVNGRIRLTPETVAIEALDGWLDQGQFHLNGKADIKGMALGKGHLTIKAERLPISVPDTLDVVLDADLSLSGTPDQAGLKGAVTLVAGEYYKDVNLNLIQMVGQPRRKVAPSRPPRDIPFLQHLDLDVSLTHTAPFLVDNNLALLAVKPDLRFQGTAARPQVSGRALVDSGTVTYQNREFDVQRGEIAFLNPYRLEPTLDVAAEAQVRKWTISLSIQGTPDALKFALTSDPSETHADILSLLLFGRTTSELSSGGGSSGATAAQAANRLLDQGLARDVMDVVGLDRLEVDYQEGDNQEGAYGVRLEKTLSRNLSVNYKMENKSGQAVQKATTEYKFLEHFLIRASQDSRGHYGGELSYRLEFR